MYVKKKKLPKTKPILIGSVYRPPQQCDFLDNFDRLMEGLPLDQEKYIIGDMNICDKSRSKLRTSYKNILNTHGMSQIITSYTRLSQTPSLIDHIICNTTDKIKQHGILDKRLSDHQIIYCTRKTQKFKFFEHNELKIRSLKNYTVDKYLSLLQATDWSTVYSSKDPDTAWSAFKTILSTVLDAVAPKKTVRIKQNSDPWITEDILSRIAKRDHLLASYRKSGKEEIHKQYCKIRNELQRDIKKAKCEFFESQINKNMGRPRKLWQNLKKIGYSNTSKSKTKIVLRITNKLCHDTLQICNYVNEFFTTVAANLV